MQGEQVPVLVIDLHLTVCEDLGTLGDAAGDPFAEGADERHACRVEVGDIPADEGCGTTGVLLAGFVGSDVHVAAGDGLTVVGAAVALFPEAEGGGGEDRLTVAYGNAEREVLRVAVLAARAQGDGAGVFGEFLGPVQVVAHACPVATVHGEFARQQHGFGHAAGTFGGVVFAHGPGAELCAVGAGEEGIEHRTYPLIV